MLQSQIDHRQKRRRKLLNSPAVGNKTGALFLDRDGIIIHDKHYIGNPDKVEIHEGSIRLLEYALSKKIPVVVITNQSGISRGYLQWEDYEKVTHRMLSLLGESAASIYGIYANGYMDTDRNGSWRKPRPEMIISAAMDLNICLSKSILIGDRLSDLDCGANANLNTVIHIMTGHGAKEKVDIDKRVVNQEFIGNDHTPIFKRYQNLGELPLRLLNGCITGES